MAQNDGPVPPFASEIGEKNRVTDLSKLISGLQLRRNLMGKCRTEKQGIINIVTKLLSFTATCNFLHGIFMCRF